MNEMMPDIKINSYDKMDNMILDLLAGRIDVGLTSLSFLSPLMKKPEGKKLRLIGPKMTKGPFGRGVAVGIRKEDAKLKEMFDKADRRSRGRRQPEQAGREVVRLRQLSSRTNI
jgi:octopine/nopaline transport system substrate-binding protein